MNVNVRFCRAMLSSLRADLAESHPDVRLQEHAWVYDFKDGHWEMQGSADGPAAGYYWYGSADNAYDARYKGWAKWRDNPVAQKVYKEWRAKQRSGKAGAKR